MILLLDIGNTRVKAAVTEPFRALGVTSTGDQPEAALAGVVPAGVAVRRVVACCVAGDEVRAAYADACRRRLGVGVDFVSASDPGGGVRPAYPHPERLGADRWAAMVGAWSRVGGAVTVVDAGSALTVDGIADDGRHLGGVIAPGVGMMREALDRRTGDLAELAARPAAEGETPLPADTGAAIAEGTLLAAVSLVERCARTLGDAVGRVPKLLITGGDAQRLAERLGPAAEVIPDLTLRGLEVLAAEPNVREDGDA